MNESETRAEYIDPKLKASGWGEVEESKILREVRITEGRIQVGGKRSTPEIADYVLVYKNRRIARVLDEWKKEQKIKKDVDEIEIFIKENFPDWK